MTDQPLGLLTWWLSSCSQKTTGNREKTSSGGILPMATTALENINDVIRPWAGCTCLSAHVIVPTMRLA